MHNSYKEFAEKINEFSSFTILMHNNPDGDSISSMFALKKVLEKLNKHVDLAIHNHIPENFKFWFDRYRNKVLIPKHKNECLIIVDTPSAEKTYPKYKELGEYVITIDHHKNNTKFGDLNIWKITSSTGVILYEIIKYMDIPIDKMLAEFLYISICWDTDGFKNNFATSYIYEIAAELVSLGAVPQRVYRYLFEYKKHNELDIQKLFFNSIEKDKNIHYIKLTESHLSIIDNSNIYNFLYYIRLLDNIELFIMFIDRGDYMEIKMNNNQPIYIHLKNKYKKLYNIPIDTSFNEDCDNILLELNKLAK